MSDFFHGWRRKVGCVSLTIALAFILGWTRSLSHADFLGTVTGNQRFFIVSYNGLLDFQIPLRSSLPNPGQNAFGGNQATTVVAVTVPRAAQTTDLVWGSLRLAWYLDGVGVRARSFDILPRIDDVEWKRQFGRFEYLAANDGSQ